MSLTTQSHDKLTSSTPIFRQASKKLSTFRLHRAIVSLGCEKEFKKKLEFFIQLTIFPGLYERRFLRKYLKIFFIFYSQLLAKEHECFRRIGASRDSQDDKVRHRRSMKVRDLPVEPFLISFRCAEDSFTKINYQAQE